MQKILIMKEWVLKRPAGGINNLFNQNCQDIYCKRYLSWTFSQGKKRSWLFRPKFPIKASLKNT